jgi:hypothetical protein
MEEKEVMYINKYNTQQKTGAPLNVKRFRRTLPSALEAAVPGGSGRDHLEISRRLRTAVQSYLNDLDF